MRIRDNIFVPARYPQRGIEGEVEAEFRFDLLNVTRNRIDDAGVKRTTR